MLYNQPIGITSFSFEKLTWCLHLFMASLYKCHDERKLGQQIRILYSFIVDGKIHFKITED